MPSAPDTRLLTAFHKIVGWRSEVRFFQRARSKEKTMTDEQVRVLAAAIRGAGVNIMMGLMVLALMTLEGSCIVGAG